MTSDAGEALIRLPLPRVAERCQEESARYARHVEHDARFCFELFRRAVVLKDQRAWEAVYIQYTRFTPVARFWVERHSLFRATGEDADYFVNRAFERMWSALTADKFARFADLASLLRYLKMCAHSAITDYLRARQAETAMLDETYQGAAADNGSERLQGSEMWKMLAGRLADEKERVAMYCRFGLEMKPSEIQAAYPARFESVRDVYAVLQNVMKRLRRDRELQEYLAGTAEIR